MITRRSLLKASAATGLTLATTGLSAPSIAQGAKKFAWAMFRRRRGRWPALPKATPIT